MAWVSTAPLRPCAARAALPGQARSHICFGPVMSGPLPGPPFLFGLGLGQGRQAHGLGFSSVLETVRRPRGASRARARRPPRSYICFGPIMSVGLPGPPCWFALGLGQGHQVHGLGFYSVLETARRPRGASRASPLLHLFRASYACAIAWTALFVWLEIGSGPPGAWLEIFGALETVRRPRGASRAPFFRLRICDALAFYSPFNARLINGPTCAIEAGEMMSTCAHGNRWTFRLPTNGPQV